MVENAGTSRGISVDWWALLIALALTAAVRAALLSKVSW